MLEALLGATPSGTGPQPGDTTLLMHFDGSDGDTTFVDELGHSTRLARNGSSLKTDRAKFGPSSFFTNGGLVAIGESSDAGLQLTGAFTIEFWFNVSNQSQNVAMMGKGSNAFLQYFNGTIYMRDDSGTYQTTASVGFTNTWTHVAFTKSAANVWDAWVNGQRSGASTTSANTWGVQSAPLLLGSSLGYDAPWTGWIDELRICTNAVYSGPFTPPAAPFTL